MTDRIDLDERTEAPADSPERPNRGDWLWRDSTDTEGSESGDAVGTDADDDGSPGGPAEAVGGSASRADRPAPHVPRPAKDRPVGIPVEGGGADAGAAADGQQGAGGAGPDATPSDPTDEDTTAGGPHGGGADDMTMAITYAAAARLGEPAAAFADAARWADWVGIVGDVAAPEINKFQRDHGVDVDFFNGSGTGPGERLAGIDERSMFFAERMVVVGLSGRDEDLARRAGWEFVPLAEAAEKAGWALAE